jgi:mannitol-1-/sugar-/sorbitol-6-phosphatase
MTSTSAAPSSRQPTALPAHGVLFDCDGVLVDSDASVISAWSRWAQHFALAPDHVVGLVHGRRAVDTVSALIDAGRRDDALELINQFEVEDASTVRAIPGARDLVRSLPPRVWAVVTSGLLPLATARLRAAGLPLPDVLVTADLVRRGKPDPEGYLLAADRLGLVASECVVVEDAVEGVRAARAAGVGGVVGVGSRLDPRTVDAHVDDLRQLSWMHDVLTAGPPDHP